MSDARNLKKSHILIITLIALQKAEIHVRNGNREMKKKQKGHQNYVIAKPIFNIMQQSDLISNTFNKFHQYPTHDKQKIKPNKRETQTDI